MTGAEIITGGACLLDHDGEPGVMFAETAKVVGSCKGPMPGTCRLFRS